MHDPNEEANTPRTLGINLECPSLQLGLISGRLASDGAGRATWK